MPFDYKKEYREFYLPPKKPHLITIPRMNFVAVHGKGDPNVPGGAYQEAMGVLYGIAFTIKMSYKGSHKMDGYFEWFHRWRACGIRRAWMALTMHIKKHLSGHP